MGKPSSLFSREPSPAAKITATSGIRDVIERFVVTAVETVNEEGEHEQNFNALIRRVTVGRNNVVFNGTYYNETSNKSERMPGLAQPKQLIETFEYKDNSIIFNYSAAYYESPEDITFSYILEGFNQEWSEWTKETKKEYINLELKHEIHMGSYYIDTHDRKRRETA